MSTNTSRGQQVVSKEHLLNLLRKQRTELERVKKELEQVRLSSVFSAPVENGYHEDESELRLQLEELRTKLAMVETEKNDMQQRLLTEKAALASDLQAETDRSKDLKEKLIEKETALNEIQTQLENMKAEKAKEEAIERDPRKEFAEKLKELEENFAKQQKHSSNLEDQLNELRMERHEKESLVSKLRSEITCADEAIAKVEHELAEAREDSAKLNMNCKDLEAQLTEERSGNQEKESLLERLRSELKKSQELLSEKEAQWEIATKELKAIKDELSRQQKRAEDLEVRLNENVCKLEHLQRSSTESDELVKTRDEELVRVRTTMNEIVENSQTLKREHEESKFAMKTSVEQMKALKGELDDLKISKENAEAEILRANDQIKALRKRLQLLNSEWESPTDLEDLPAPYFGFESPEVNYIFENWTSDRTKINKVRAWCLAVLSGRDHSTFPSKLEIVNLRPEIAQGFTQLIVPILRSAKPELEIRVQTKAELVHSVRMSLSKREP